MAYIREPDEINLVVEPANFSEIDLEEIRACVQKNKEENKSLIEKIRQNKMEEAQEERDISNEDVAAFIRQLKENKAALDRISEGIKEFA